MVVRVAQLTVEIGGRGYTLETEDSMHFQATTPYKFVNRSTEDCRYYILIVHTAAGR